MAVDAGNQITVWNIVSLLAGTIISAIVSYGLQQRSFKEAREQKAQDKTETRKTLGLNLFHKMMRIASTLEILKRHVEAVFARAEAEKRQPWSLMMPLGNLPDRVKFTAEELTFLMLMDMTLFNDMGPFDDIHNSLLELFDLYQTKRMALTDMLPATMSAQTETSDIGITGTTELNTIEMRKLAPRMAELNVLAQGMNQRAQQDAKEAWELLEKLRDALNKEFGLHLSFERK